MVSVLHLINSLAPYGAESLLALLAQYRDPSRLRMAVGVLHEPFDLQPAIERAGVEVFRLGGHGGLSDVRAMSRARNLILQWSAEVVHTHISANYWGRMGAFLAGRPVLVHEHALPTAKPLHYLFADQILSRRTGGFAVPSRAVKRVLSSLVHIAPERIAIVPNCIDFDAFQEAPETTRSFREEWGVPPGTLVIGTAGRLHEEKGLDVMLHALAILKTRGGNFLFVALGEGPERRHLELLAREMGVAELARFPGYRHDISGCLAAIDLFVLPSRTESFGMALVEAMYAGLPVIASRIEGPLEIVEEGVTGILFPMGSHEALAAEIHRLAQDPTLRQRMGAAAKKSVQARFSPVRFAETLTGLYLELRRDHGIQEE